MTGPRLRALQAIAVVLAFAAAGAEASEMKFTVRNRVLHRIDARMFGQFMERASWAGEIGAEAGLTPGTRDLQAGVVKLLREAQIPIIRFPGGTDADFLDWRDMIDNVPGRATDRPMSRGHTGNPITNNFGYDEFLRLAEDLKADTILVVNFGNAILRVKPLQEAAREAASLVAYCNAPPGARLPEGMEDWPAVRSKNGRPKPYGVKYFQIGNETWNLLKRMKEAEGDHTEEFYIDCLTAYVDAMREVDPSIQIIIDGHPPWLPEMARERLGQKIQYVALHEYRPWGISEVKKGGEVVPTAELSEEAIWYAWVAVPAIDDMGRSVLRQRDGVETARELGYKVAVTEWNWNGGWWGYRGRPPSMDSLFAKGVGAAGFIHGLMRAGHTVEIGCQSMLLGNRWDITAIRADPNAGFTPFLMPTGQVTMFYSKYHGSGLLDLESENVPTYAQPYQMGGIGAVDKVAYVDALATGDGTAIYFHAINRYFDRAAQIVIDVSDFGASAGKGVHHVLEGRLRNAPGPGEPRQIGRVRHEPIEFGGGSLEITLPRRSVSCVEVRL